MKSQSAALQTVETVKVAKGVFPDLYVIRLPAEVLEDYRQYAKKREITIATALALSLNEDAQAVRAVNESY